MSAGVCRSCGCTTNEACFSNGTRVYQFRELETFSDEQLQEMELEPCYWVEPDLCSHCLLKPPAPLLVDQHGNPLRGAP